MRHLLPLLLVAACLQPGIKAPAQPAAVTPELAKAATHQVLVQRNHPDFGSYQTTGTAWVVASGEVRSFLITAGHVCNPKAGDTVSGLTLVSSSKVHRPAHVMATLVDPDLCLLVTLGNAGPALPVAPEDPTWSTPVTYVGAPLAYWGSTIPMYSGQYVGGDMITAPVAPGASGSAAWSSSGVIGVVARVAYGFPTAAFIVTRGELAAFLEKHLP